MKTTVRLLGFGLAGLALMACNDQGSTSLKTQKDKVSYIIGHNIGLNMQQQQLDETVLDLDKLRAGMKDAMNGVESQLPEEEMAAIMSQFQEEMPARLDSINSSRGEANAKAGEEFLTKNAEEDGVVVLPSGLQYQVITEGTGKKPGPTSVVTVHYHGTLIDGTSFDSSIERGQPATFPVNGVIAGWTEALQLMSEGAKWKLFIPADLAYGEQAASNLIGPNSVLIFEVELISVND
ncbi:MAG TPA: FKBP-type peptidyl-prolyl cis-trans isomerase [Fibrobacteria bacterium]|nr:FKBP-type peptidyl-prolyl cis-trans isomerase [Fibrobacteria bacterium]